MTFTIQASTRIEAADDAWWKSLSKTEQDAYIKKHPNSKYAKSAKASGPSASPKAKAKPHDFMSKTRDDVCDLMDDEMAHFDPKKQEIEMYMGFGAAKTALRKLGFKPDGDHFVKDGHKVSLSRGDSKTAYVKIVS